MYGIAVLVLKKLGNHVGNKMVEKTVHSDINCHLLWCLSLAPDNHSVDYERINE